MEHPPPEAWRPFETTLPGADIDPGDHATVLVRLLARMTGGVTADEVRIDSVVPELPGFGDGGFWEPVRWCVTGAFRPRYWHPPQPEQPARKYRHTGGRDIG